MRRLDFREISPKKVDFTLSQRAWSKIGIVKYFTCALQIVVDVVVVHNTYSFFYLFWSYFTTISWISSKREDWKFAVIYATKSLPSYPRHLPLKLKSELQSLSSASSTFFFSHARSINIRIPVLEKPGKVLAGESDTSPGDGELISRWGELMKPLITPKVRAIPSSCGSPCKRWPIDPKILNDKTANALARLEPGGGTRHGTKLGRNQTMVLH